MLRTGLVLVLFVYILSKKRKKRKKREKKEEKEEKEEKSFKCALQTLLMAIE
jgi:hypothetical protein